MVNSEKNKTTSHNHEIPEKFSNIRALLLGDIMLDKYVYGSVARISPEAPIPVLLHQDEKSMLGGAGNVFSNLISLSGKHHVLLSLAGEDENLSQLKKMLNSTGAKYQLFLDPERRTSLKMRFIAQRQQVVRYDVESTGPLNRQIQAKILYEVSEEIDFVDIVILSDYSKGFFNKELIQDIIKLAKKAGKLIFIDPKDPDFSSYTGADFIKPNRKELQEASGISLKTTDDIILAARTLCEKYSIGNIIVTLSEEGMVFIPGNGDDAIHQKISHSPAFFDVSGAGDTVLAVLSLAIASGIPLVQAMQLANAAAQVVIAKPGTATLTQAEILHYLNSSGPGRDIGVSGIDFSEKIVTLSQAKEIVKLWKNQGDSVCFTNGCFDLLHSGHLSSLLQAKKHGDRLVVALNNDASVKRIKGSSRPVQDEKTRASVMAALQCVDLVILFDEDTALNIVKELRPDIIAKEGYTLEKWPEARFVQGFGGKVLFLERNNGNSTSELIDRINYLREKQNAE